MSTVTAEQLRLPVRASSMPLAIRCGGSVRLPEGDAVAVDPVNEAADVGTAVHAVMAPVVRDALESLPDITPIAAAHGVDADEVGILSAMAFRMWRKIDERWIGRVLAVEERFEDLGGNIVGHGDVVAESKDASALIILDWKTGRLDANHYDQMAAYAELSIDNYDHHWEKYDRVIVILAWVRDEEIEVYEFNRELLARWVERFVDNVIEWDGTYRHGGHCRHCPRSIDCPARRALVRSTAAELADSDGQTVDDLLEAVARPDAPVELRDQVIDLYGRAKLVIDVAERLKAAIRDDVLPAVGGALVGSDETLMRVEQDRTYLKTRKAWGVFARHVQDPSALLDAVTISKTKALDACTADAPRGTKGNRKKAIEAELAEAGASYTKPIASLRVKRAVKELPA